MTDTIEQQLQRLQDLEDIKTLRHRFAHHANIIDGQAGDLKAFAALFAPDSTLNFGAGVATGPAEIEAMAKGPTSKWQCLMHFMLNPVIELEGDRAHGIFNGLFAFVGNDSPSPVWLSNIYEDAYVRTADGWRFQSVNIRLAFADQAYLDRV